MSHGGDRAANAAIHHVVISPLAFDRRTKAYAQRRTAEGKSKKEIIRCLKRYVSREIFNQVKNPKLAPAISDLRPLRQQLGITLKIATGQLSLWPSALSRIERGLSGNDDLAEEYRAWLSAQLTLSEESSLR